MTIANIQAQIAYLTSLLSQHIERTTMQSAPAYGVQGYQAHQRPQRGWENVDTWGYQSPNQSRNDVFSNTYNSDWIDHSNSMWWEPQQGQQKHIGSHMRSSILALCSLPRNNFNRLQVCQWIIIKVLMN